MFKFLVDEEVRMAGWKRKEKELLSSFATVMVK